MEQAVLSLKRAAWLPRVLPNAVVVSGQQTSDQYNRATHMHMLTATSSTRHFRLSPLLQGFSFPPVLKAYSVDQLTHTNSNLWAQQILFKALNHYQNQSDYPISCHGNSY